MRNPKFLKISPNYRKNVLEITLEDPRKVVPYNLPFAAFPGRSIGSRNRFTAIEIDTALDSQAARFELQDGTRGDFPADLVLYYCDPTYHWSPINQLKRALKEKLAASRLSIRVLADALSTSPSQVVRLLATSRASRQLLQLFQLAELAGYEIDLSLRRKDRGMRLRGLRRGETTSLPRASRPIRIAGRVRARGRRVTP